MNFFLKKERVFFFRGSALQVFGQCGGAKCGFRHGERRGWRGGISPCLRLLFLTRKIIHKHPKQKNHQIEMVFLFG
ncbi:hypothetical protein A2Y47_02505 [Candidatus Giovannonibacteria bacterium RIFCSPLOWO2_12_43_8]|uniref:Uncharacterized protein n=1 Tax=Candidatus Giovannonibacteria bacterium RIFCSPLOWO2_12_43_8 TaxID=1798361 RepID=A0A1F5Y1M4_9BACT|nr:MAG: hypothetical protein A2Y47_02505 [Candidatus Giovannonibacteria bacterium RIFCSPLOWO2_12_43_8]